MEQAIKIISLAQESRNSWARCKSRTCCGNRLCRSSKLSKSTILDLRTGEHFTIGHIPGSLNSPLKDISSQPSDVYGDAKILHLYWSYLMEKFDENSNMLGSKAKPLLVVCYNGEISRLACSILRARGYASIYVAGGYPAFARYTFGKR